MKHVQQNAAPEGAASKRFIKCLVLKLFYLQALFLRYVAAVIATAASPSKHTYVATSLSSPLFGDFVWFADLSVFTLPETGCLFVSICCLPAGFLSSGLFCAGFLTSA